MHNNIGIGDIKGKKIITINKLTSTSTLSEIDEDSFFLKIKNLLLKQKKENDSYEVETETIDEYFKDLELKNSLLKIDVEGYELNVLKGAQNTIKKIDFVLIENQFFNLYKNSDFKECDNFLINNQFTLIKKFRFPTFHYEDRVYKNKLT